MSKLRVGLLLLALVATDSRTLAILYVDADALGANDGSTWCTAYLTLQDALAVATSGETIRVADGLYKFDQGAGQTPSDRAAVSRCAASAKDGKVERIPR